MTGEITTMLTRAKDVLQGFGATALILVLGVSLVAIFISRR